MYPSGVVTPPWSHAISFFQNERQLCQEIATFVAEGLGAGEPALVVTTESHRAGIVRELHARAVDVAGSLECGDLLLLDAEETLATLMRNGVPDAALYHEKIGAAVTQLLRGRPGPLRIFGEMVDLLWQRGEHDAAIRVELLSNQLALRQPISVLCGYSMGHFLKTAVKLDLVRNLHGRVHEPAGRANDRPRQRTSRTPQSERQTRVAKSARKGKV